MDVLGQAMTMTEIGGGAVFLARSRCLRWQPGMRARRNQTDRIPAFHD